MLATLNQLQQPSAGSLRRRTSALLMLLCCLLLCSPVQAQKPGKPRGMKPGQENGQRVGGRGRNEPLLSEQLPAPFHGISNEELPILLQLAQRAKRWILYDTAPESPFDPVRVSFIPPAHNPAADDVDTSANAADEHLQIGLLILSRLTLEQRRLLATALADTLSDQQKISLLDQKLCLVLQKVRDETLLSRVQALETEARRDLLELGRTAASLATRQARVFAQLEKSLSQEQRDSLVLATTSSFVPESGLPGMHEVEAELKNADSEQRNELKRMAHRAAFWTAQQATAAIDTGSQQTPPKKERTPDPQLQDFLKTLLPPQQKQLRSVFDAEVRRLRQQMLLSAAALTSLQGLRTSRSLDEKKVQQSTVACAQLQFSAALAESAAFETIRQSVSKQQLEYLTGSGDQ